MNNNRVNPINFLKSTATICVFALHATLFDDTSFFNKRGYTFLLRTPAWASVWIFVLISGYLAGCSYATQRYNYTFKSISEYYKKKIRRVFVPVGTFIFICWALHYPDFIIGRPIVLLKFLTLTYRGDPGNNGIGACWFVFMIGMFYLITPYICRLISTINNTKKFIVVYTCTLMLGLCFRINNYRLGLDWSGRTYASFWGNFDLYVIGILMAFYREKLRPHIEVTLKRKIATVLILVDLIVINAWIYNQAYFYQITSWIGPYWFWYQYLFPTIYAVIVSAYFDTFHEINKCIQSPLNVEQVCQNPFRVIDWFAGISFEFYLFHSWILSNFAPYIKMTTALESHLWLLGISATITVILSIGFQKIFK